MANVYEPEWDAERDEPPYRWRRSRIGRQTGARQLVPGARLRAGDGGSSNSDAPTDPPEGALDVHARRM